jgi:lambda family phage portal protein
MELTVTGELTSARPEKTAGLGGGAFEGADRLGRELATWRPRLTTADGALGFGDKILLDGRARDLLRNNGPILGASNFHKDSIVGHQYRLNANPAWKALGLSAAWAEEFQEEVEMLFNLYAESEECFLDVDRTKTLTDMVRLAVGCFFAGGEVVATANWMTSSYRPFKTAFQLIDADRVSNPQDLPDTRLLRRGVSLTANGSVRGVHIRRAHPYDVNGGPDLYTWSYWPMRTGWGRTSLLHILDQQRPDQHRGVAQLATILKEARMGKKFHEVGLANAIVQASYAAAIESELPPDAAFDGIGALEAPDRTNSALSMLQAIAEYSRGGRNIEIDGTKIPYLFPGTKLKMMPAGQPGGMGERLEESFNRHMSTALDVSYEEFTNDYSKTNYSSAKAAGNNTLKAMTSRKRKVADKTANAIYTNWLEEAITEDRLETTRQLTRRDSEFFYRNLNKAALSRATWIGASRGQVDENKETDAAVKRIENNLSTIEAESARLGLDFREIFEQRRRENRLMAEAGLTFAGSGKGQAPTATAEEPTQETDDGFDD